MPLSYPSYADYLSAFQSMFQGLTSDKMHLVTLALRLRIQERYEASPFALRVSLLSSLDDPAVESDGMPRPDPAAVYAHTPAGVAERNEAQDLTALADSFDAATRAMKQTIISFVPVDTRDLLYIDEALTTQTVNGMLTILEDQFGEMPASQQHALAASLRNPFNPRTETVGQFLSHIRHVRSTLSKVGQIFSDDVFSEYICNAIIAGAPEFAVPLDYYRNTSEARDLNRLYRIINDKATTMAAAQANAAHAPADISSVPASANAMLPSGVTNNRSNSNTRDTSGRNRAGRGRGGGRRNNRNVQSRGARVPDHEIATLASQLQDYFRIQAQRYPTSSSQPSHSHGHTPTRSPYHQQAPANPRQRHFGAHSVTEQPDDVFWDPWEMPEHHN